MNNITKTKIIKQTEIIEQAQLMIKFCIDNSIYIDADVLSTVLLYKETCGNNGEPIENTELKIKFLDALAKLNILIQPVSIKNIMVLEERYFPRFLWIPNKKKLVSFADKILFSYRMLGLLTFIILMMLQCYWLIGLSLRNDCIQNRTKLEDVKYKLTLIDSSKNVQLYANSQRELSWLSRMDVSSDSAMLAWNKVTGIYKVSKSLAYSTNDSPEAILSSVNYKLTLLDSYFLPFLYGLLGAIVFALRKIPRDIENYTFSKYSKNFFITRVYLGAFSGLAVGWFTGKVSSDSVSAVSRLSPLAVSFVSGYSIEILFAFIDKAIASFTSKDAKQEKGVSNT